MSATTEQRNVLPTDRSTMLVASLVFIGVGQFGAACLRSLVGSGLSPQLVLTSPVHRLSAPVEQICRCHGIPCSRPKTYNGDAVRSHIKEMRADLGVIAGAGEILRKRILAVPRLGFVNVHLSLLPKYRGPRPWKWAIARGETQSGVTVHHLDEGIDTGPILAQRAVDITSVDTADSLFEKLTEQAPGLLLRSIEGILSGRIHPEAQDPTSGSYYSGPKLSDAHFSWHWPTQRICDLIRGFAPWPGGQCRLGSQRVRIVRASIGNAATDAQPGTIVSIPSAGEACVATSDGVLHVHGVYCSSDRLVIPQPRQRFTAEKHLQQSNNAWQRKF